MTQQNNEPSAHLKYLTPKQLQTLRHNLFSKAAESMGERVNHLKEGRQTQGRREAIEAIRSEWVVKG